MDGFLTFKPQQPQSLVFCMGGTAVVTINQNGTIEYGPGYTPDDAAKAFWDAVKKLYPFYSRE